jgi:hypothetical protein
MSQIEVTATPDREWRKNLRLGYHVELIMQEFLYYLNQQEIKFAFIPRFEEMSPASSVEAQKWRANRREAYLGSFRHFLAAMTSGRLKPEELPCRARHPS